MDDRAGESLRRAVGRWLDDHLDDVLTQATAEAKAEAVGRLRALFVEEIMRAAADRLSSRRAAPEPPSSDVRRHRPSGAGSGYYIYGVTSDNHPGPDPAVSGVDPNAPVVRIGHGSLAALVGRVSLQDFDEDALTDPADGMRNLETKVRAHEAVLESALGRGAVVPMRFGTTCANSEEVRGVLSRHERELDALLRKVSGRSEWTVRGSYERDALARWVAANSDEIAAASPPEQLGPGRAYWAQRKADEVLAREVEGLALDWAHRCHDRLSAVAAESAWNAPGRFGESDAQVVLNGAYLVENSSRERFMHTVEELQNLFSGRGLRLEVVGPWPPYEFARLESNASP